MKRFFLFFMVILFCGCASSTVPPLGIYYPKEIPDVEQIRSAVENRNKTIETHPYWRMIAAKQIISRSLEDIPASEYIRFREYLDNGVMYVIVHPAYYFYFNDDFTFPSTDKDIGTFLQGNTLTKRNLVLREQERALRDFLEITSTRNRLILLILPGNYREFSGYKYRFGEDEFARYINEVTNESNATLYLYSEKPNRGMLSKESMELFLNFIKAVNPEKIVLGGGYLGRCLEDFYRQASNHIRDREIEIDPWISAVSPEDLNYLDLSDLIMDGRLDMSLMKEIQRDYARTNNNSFRDLLKNYRNNRGKRE